MDWAQASLSLDVGTLFVIAICVTLLLGLLLLLAWTQERIPALGWWGAAYLIGAFSGAIWRFGDLMGPALPGIANILLFVTVGMIWSAARLFHGRRVRWGLMFLGAAVWLVAWLFPAFAHSAVSRILVSSLIIAGYTFLIAVELWRERRQFADPALARCSSFPCCTAPSFCSRWRSPLFHTMPTCSAVSPAAGLRCL